jgi:hypothetical protein
MKIVVSEHNEAELITDAFKIEVKENDENIHIQVVEFDSEKEMPWTIIQYQIIEKKREHSKDILTHVTEEIEN